MSLNSAQYEAVAYKDGPCMVLAGPGSGKTLTITKRIEYLMKQYKVRPEEILVITFTKYASFEMKKRFCQIIQTDDLPVTFGTFHGVYYGILQWTYGVGTKDLLTGDERYQLLRRAVSMICPDLPISWEEEKEYLEVLSAQIGNVKNNLEEEKEESEYTGKTKKNQQFWKIYDMYEQLKKKMKKIDFEDMLLMCLELFRERKDILKSWQKRFRYILVDEFQDINLVQYEVLKLLALPENNLFIVGDDDQSVYGFRGARPDIMLNFQKDYPQAGKIVLPINYRSDGYIVKGSQRVIGFNTQRYKKDIHSTKEAKENVHVQEVKNPSEEGEYIIGKIKEYYEKGIAHEDMAILFRMTADARAITQKLSENHIPFHMKEYLDNLYDHFIAKDVESYLRLSIGERKRQYFLQIANKPKRYIGRDSMQEQEVSYESLRGFYCDKKWMMDRIDQLEWDIKMLEGRSPFLAIQYIRKSIGYDEYLREYAAFRNISAEKLLDVLEEIQEHSKGYKNVGQWLEHVENYKKEWKCQRDIKSKAAGKKRGVALLTMHAAKGLEYDTVFVIRGNEGITPHKKAKTRIEIEEERRLFYVAMTRAKRKLIISYVKEKNGKDIHPSRFVQELLCII